MNDDPTLQAAIRRANPPRVVKAREAALAEDMPARAAAALVLRGCHAQWLGNEAAVRFRAVEGVHQMRVALRRLRAALVLFRAMAPPERLNLLDAEVRWLAGLLGTARDWDVFLETSLAPLLEQRSGEIGLMEMRQTVEELRGTAYDAVLAALESARYTALASEVAMLAGDIQSAGPGELATSELARHALDLRYTKLLRRGRRLEKLDSEQRHRVRIELKKLRYCADFFRAIFPDKRRREFAKELGRLQDLFGALNDAATAERLVRSLVPDGTGEAQLDAAHAAGLVIGWHASEARRQQAGLAKQWRRFVATKPFWR